MVEDSLKTDDVFFGQSVSLICSTVLVFDDCGMFLRSMLKFGWVLMIVMGGVLTQGQLLLPEGWEQAPSQR